MKNMLKFVCICTLITTIGLLAIGCEKENTKSSIEKESSDYPITNIKWHLTKFVDVAEKKEETPMPVDNDHYWIRLSNGMVNGLGEVNELIGMYVEKQNQKISIDIAIATKVGIIEDKYEKPFASALNEVQSYETSDGTLRLFYNNGKNYLQFEKVAE